MNIFIFAGEKSGDLHGARLIQSLKKKGATTITAVAGPLMRQEEINVLCRTEEFEVMGFSEVLYSLPKIIKQFKKVRSHILETNPDAVILIDYPGFNLRLAKSLRKKGYKGKLIQYVAPTFWAWGKKRRSTLVNNYDLLLSIYPFEESYFEKTPLQVAYVGNPVQESVQNHSYQAHWAETLGLPSTHNLIALFPGSRKVEVRRNLPIQLHAALQIKKRDPSARFALSCANTHIMPLMQKILEALPLKPYQDIFFVPKLYSYELMRDARSAIAKSGTVTLELALHQCPTVVMYQMSPFNYFIAKNLIRLDLPHYCMANIISGKTVFPELIKQGCTPERLLETFLPLNEEGNIRDLCKENCVNIASLLEGHQTSERAAQAIVSIL